MQARSFLSEISKLVRLRFPKSSTRGTENFQIAVVVWMLGLAIIGLPLQILIESSAIWRMNGDYGRCRCFDNNCENIRPHVDLPQHPITTATKPVIKEIVKIIWPLSQSYDWYSCFGVFQITVGRSTADNHVDVDLSLEGPAWKISRRQAVIKLRSDGEYCVINEGRRPLYIDGKPVVLGTKARLHHNSTFEVIYRNSRVNKVHAWWWYDL